MKLNFFIRLFSSLILIGTMGCKQTSSPKKEEFRSSVNTAHLDHLYQEIKMGDDTVGIIHIYAEAPDYHWVDDSDEGFACVDDVSRAAIFYFNEYKRTEIQEYLRKGRMLLKFVLAMQAENGYYYNFIWPNGTINKEGITSKAEPSWWSWRAWWALEIGGGLLKDDPAFSEVELQRKAIIKNVLNEPSFRSTKTDTAFGLTIPTWLPKSSGTDQAAIILMLLTQDFQHASETLLKDSIRTFAHHFADGIMMMQVHAPGQMEDGAFLSWENLWHAYGNIQSMALLGAGVQLQDSTMINAAKYEIDHFYPAILARGGLDHFWIKQDGDTTIAYDVQAFNQIAYGRSPMIHGAMQAYLNSTGRDTKYIKHAEKLAMWFFGDNPAGQMMYDPATGRGYDGIQSAKEINRNAGAESTIEALLSIQLIETWGGIYDPKTKSFLDPLK